MSNSLKVGREQKAESDWAPPVWQALRILQFAFVVIPLVAGTDKFFRFLTSSP